MTYVMGAGERTCIVGCNFNQRTIRTILPSIKEIIFSYLRNEYCMQMKWLGEAAYRMTPDMCENRISANLMDSARESTFTCVLDLKYAISLNRYSIFLQLPSIC